MPVLTPIENPLDTPITPTIPATDPSIGDITGAIDTTYNNINVDTPTWETPADLDTSLTAGTDYLTPETKVADQLTNLLQGDSPYMQQVENRSREQANKLGLLSTSMAVGAGQRAAIESALPIAQQDAQTAAGFLGQEQQADYDISKDLISTKLNADYTKYKSEIDTAYTAAIKGADAQVAAIYQDAQNKWNYDIQVSLKDFDNQWSERLANGQVSQERYNTAMTSIGQITQNTASNTAALLADPDIASMDAATVANLLQSIQDHSLASISFVGGVGGIDPDELQILLDSFDTATQWEVGSVPQDA